MSYIYCYFELRILLYSVQAELKKFKRGLLQAATRNLLRPSSLIWAGMAGAVGIIALHSLPSSHKVLSSILGFAEIRIFERPSFPSNIT